MRCSVQRGMDSFILMTILTATGNNRISREKTELLINPYQILLW